jgi:3-oxoacyl-[acyl-carrier protein] reductase
MDTADKVALVTGAGSGIGRATALRLAAEGAAVVVDDIDEDAGGETVRMLEEGAHRAAFVRTDVADEGEVQAMIAFAEKTFGGLDILVNNAGVYIEPPYFPEAQVSRWSRIIDVYLRATMLCMHYGIEAMRRRGGGAVVNISSGAGIGLRPHGSPEYAAAKAGVWRLTAALGDLAERINVRVNCICPGWVNTPASQRTLAQTARDEWPATMVQAEEIADAVVGLVRDDTLAGRVMLYYEGRPPRLLPLGKEE